MTRSRKLLLAMAALAVPAYFLPWTREQFSWGWAQSQNKADGYLRYLSDWPAGRHADEARLFYQERQWAETKMAQIREANSATHDAAVDEAYRREQAARRDDFLWRRATNDNTLASYTNYLARYPAGHHAAEACRVIQILGPKSAATNAIPQ